MGRPGELPDSKVMTTQQRDWLARVANIEGTDDSVNTASGDESVSVLVPIVG
jgi:hypothetical protein